MPFDANAEPADLGEIISLFLTKAAAAYAESPKIRNVSFETFCERLRDPSPAVNKDVYSTIMNNMSESEVLIQLGRSAPGIGVSFPDYKERLMALVGILEDSVNGTAKAASLLLLTDDEFNTAERAAYSAFTGTGAFWAGGDLLGDEPWPNDAERLLVLSKRVQGFFRKVKPLMDA